MKKIGVSGFVAAVLVLAGCAVETTSAPNGEPATASSGSTLVFVGANDHATHASLASGSFDLAAARALVSQGPGAPDPKLTEDLEAWTPRALDGQATYTPVSGEDVRRDFESRTTSGIHPEATAAAPKVTCYRCYDKNGGTVCFEVACKF